MIYKRLISKLKKKKSEPTSNTQYWDRAIPEQHISENAIKVLIGLQKAGFVAYLVGGGVRDLLVDKIPKDFDVATDAAPEQVKKIFRNSRIIGRRFQIVHVFYRQEIIEVTTFRAQISESALAIDPHSRAANNTFGTVEEDAWRRDFTVNALYYNNQKRVVLDFTGGMADLNKKLIRIIGDPAQRFHEDPVRLLRALRLSAKLQFDIHENTATELRLLPDLLKHVAESRLFDEMLKLFFTGHAYQTYQKLTEYHYFAALFPATYQAMQAPNTYHMQQFIELSMHETDRRYHDQDSLNPGFLLSVLLWPALQVGISEHNVKKFFFALRKAMDETLQKQAETLVIPHRLSSMMRSIWLLQYYLVQPRAKRVYRTLFHRYFRAAFDFLALRVRAGEPLQDALDWWTKFREADGTIRQQMLDEL